MNSEGIRKVEQIEGLTDADYNLISARIFEFDDKRVSTIVKFIYSEKATNFCEISIVDLSFVVTVKSTMEILQNFVAISVYINFIIASVLVSKKALYLVDEIML